MATLTYRDALNQALREEMQRDPEVFLMGEEVGVYQGAYKVSRGLLEEFGPKRIVDTPIAELGFAGIGVGAARARLRPVIEFMTWNFAVLALDQIVNSAAKILYESGGQLPIPIVFRGPNGAALQLGAQHSQAWESWLSHIPGLKVVAPATPADAKGLLKSAIRDNNPVIVLEGEMLYNTKGEVPEGEYVVPIGRADVKRAGGDVTLICHSKTVTVALKAAEQLAEHAGASAEVVDLRSLRPLDVDAITTSVTKTNRAVVVEEGWARGDGVVGQVAGAEGQTVPVGGVVGGIAGPGEAGGGQTAPASAPVPAVKGEGGQARPAPARSPAPAAAVVAADSTRVKASPLATRIATETGVDLKLVTGSGPGGRVVKRDLEEAGRREKGEVRGAAARPAVPPQTPLPSPISPAVRGGAPYEDVPLTQIRKTIAKRLATSLGPIPHFFLTSEVDMERAAEARDALNRQLGDPGKVSFNDVIIKATALALTKHRACNAWFQDDHIRYWNDVHIGMAVAVDDGLITPVIRDADRKALLDIGREARELAEKARSRRLQPNDYTGSTFSVSNLGMFDIDQFTAVINPPEAGIIAVGAITSKPVVADGQIVPRRRMRITMSCDHRVIDGATGAAYLKTLKEMLENPLAMLL